MGNVLLALFVLAVVAAVAFTDWFFPVRRDCASCGNEMLRSTTLRVTGNIVRHFDVLRMPPVWRGDRDTFSWTRATAHKLVEEGPVIEKAGYALTSSREHVCSAHFLLRSCLFCQFQRMHREN